MEPNGQEIEDISDAPSIVELTTPKNTKPIKKSSLLKKLKWIFVLALILALLIFVGSTIGVNKLRSMRAESQSVNYVSKLYPGYTIGGIVCQGEDTDSDSYVSCDLNIGNLADTADNRVINVQCPTIIKSFLGTSCKQARPSFVS
jgi:hypothetical protein